MAFQHQTPYWLLLLLLCTWYTILFRNSTSILASLTMATAPNTAKPGCQPRCGNMTIPYPFGIGANTGCSLNEMYEINCNTSFDPPKSFRGPIEMLDITDSHVRINTYVAKECYYSPGNLTNYTPWVSLSYAYSFSDELNVFTVIGCDDYAWVYGTAGGQPLSSGCMSKCSNGRQVTKESCNGMGCCQIQVPRGLTRFNISLGSFSNHKNVSSFDRCGYAFLGERDKFTFGGAADLSDPEFDKRVERTVPVVLHWDVGNGTKCREAKRHGETYLCRYGNTSCSDSSTGSGGYRCICDEGYEGNPYLPPGCTDINECLESSSNNCSHICTNVLGSYECSCPKKYDGDGFRNGTSCVRRKSQVSMIAGLGTSVGLLLIFICISIVYFIVRRRKSMKIREKFFQKNGGYLLQQQLASTYTGVNSLTIFTIDELKLATNNYSEDRVIGQGGYGTVYKGILPNNLMVAIKKSKVLDDSQIRVYQ